MLEEILQKYFNCKKPFRKVPKVTAVLYDGNKEYDYLTKSGNEAYSKLINVIYDLEKMNVIQNANSIVDKLDAIVDSDSSY